MSFYTFGCSNQQTIERMKTGIHFYSILCQPKRALLPLICWFSSERTSNLNLELTIY